MLNKEVVREVKDAVTCADEQVRADLAALVKIPSVSADPHHAADVECCAHAVADLCTTYGFDEARVVTSAGAAPAVLAHRRARRPGPHLVLYAHHDVQPTGDLAAWDSPPFTAIGHSGRWFGRGVADDKSGIMVHLAALQAVSQQLAGSVTLLVEGEEEVGSPHLDEFLDLHAAELAGDVFVIADSANWAVGEPALTTSLRGLADGVLTVRTLTAPVHSGVFGGAVLDAHTAAIRLLNSCWNDHGDLVVPGLDRAADPAVDYDPATLQGNAGVLDGVQLVGSGPISARLWTRPALTIIGIDAPTTQGAANALAASVRVKLSLRIPPGANPDAAWSALEAHLQQQAPWGAQISLQRGSTGAAWAGPRPGAVLDAAQWALAQAWSHPVVAMGVGGSIPLVAALAERNPQATMVVTGVQDPASAAHGPNESLVLAEFERACVAEALMLLAWGQ